MLATDKFTGKERDTETGLDYFGARYYGSNMGRFTSPDSTAYSSLKYPQAWNLYAYTLNNPLRFTDPTGNAVECKKKRLSMLGGCPEISWKRSGGPSLSRQENRNGALVSAHVRAADHYPYFHRYQG